MSRGTRLSVAYRLSLSVAAIALAAASLMLLGLGTYAYRQQVTGIERAAHEVQVLNAPQLTSDLWDYNDDAVREQVAALKGLRHVARVTLVTEEASVAAGEPPTGATITRTFSLSHPLGGELGRLTVVFSLASVRAAVVRESLTISLYVLVAVLAMALANLLVFRNLVTRHVDELAEYARGLTMDTLDRSFRFRRRPPLRADELDRLLGAIDTMRGNLIRELQGRRRAEEDLQRTERRYQQVFNSSGDAIFLHDAATGEVLDVNEAMLAMYGCTREQALSAAPDRLTVVDPPYLPEEAIRRLTLARRGEPQVFEWHARRWDGTPFWAEVSLKRMEPVSENLILASVRDVTERREAEARLAQLQKMESIGQLSGGVAHDFNNMLMGIQGAVELILLDDPPPEIRENAELILGTCRRSADLTAKLLAFSRRGQLVQTAVDVHGLILDALAILSRSIDKRISLRSELAAVDYLVAGDPTQLQSALLNLGLNARDAMADGGTLTLATTDRDLDADRAQALDVAPGRFLEVTAADTGAGMPPEVLEQVFEPYFTTKDVGKGTGLGLAAVYGTVRACGGAVTIDSEVGRGTTVRLLLPVAVGATASAAPGDREATTGSGGILLIDDEPVVRTATSRLLESLGYRVLTADNGAEGVDCFARRRDEIDLVILDMIMPVMGGGETFRRLRALDPEIPVLLASGYTDREEVRALLAAGAGAFLRKPYSHGELSRAVAALLPAGDGPAD